MEFQTLAEFLAQLYPKEAEIFRCIDRRPENDEIKAAEIGFRNFDVACDIECLDGDTRQFPDGRNRFLRVSRRRKIDKSNRGHGIWC